VLGALKNEFAFGEKLLLPKDKLTGHLWLELLEPATTQGGRSGGVRALGSCVRVLVSVARWTANGAAGRAPSAPVDFVPAPVSPP